MKSKKMRILVYVLAIIPVIALALLYGRLPEQIPTHWNLDGSVTYSGKETAWMLVLMAPVFSVLFDVLPHIDPRKSNYGRFGKYYDGFCVFMVLFFLVINGITLSEAMYPGKISVSTAVMLMVSVMFIFLGNMMPKIKSNFYFGIKTPWTLSDEDVWNKSQRLSGHLFFWGGLVMLLSTFLLSDYALFAVVMVFVVVTVVVPLVMSYVWYRKKHP